jgi:hypothetical protein
MKTIQRIVPDDYVPDDAASHLIAVAEALASMPEARAITSTQFVGRAEGDAIKRLVPSLAARHGLHVTVEQDDDELVVTFERDR